MTPAQLHALTTGENNVNKRSEETNKDSNKRYKKITDPSQSNLLKRLG